MTTMPRWGRWSLLVAMPLALPAPAIAQQGTAAPGASAADAQFGQRQDRGRAANSRPLARIESRVQNRIQSRINTRIDRGARPLDGVDAYTSAAGQVGTLPR